MTLLLLVSSLSLALPLFAKSTLLNYYPTGPVSSRAVVLLPTFASALAIFRPLEAS